MSPTIVGTIAGIVVGLHVYWGTAPHNLNLAWAAGLAMYFLAGGMSR